MRKDYSSTCNKCCETESPEADTLFHKVKFGLLKAFHTCFEIASTTKSLSALQVVKHYSIRSLTARMFMHKVREAMKSGKTLPMTGEVNVDEFVVFGHEPGHLGATAERNRR